MVSEEGSPELPGFPVEGGCSSPKSLGMAGQGGWVVSFTGGARRRRREEHGSQGIRSRLMMLSIEGPGGDYCEARPRGERVSQWEAKRAKKLRGDEVSRENPAEAFLSDVVAWETRSRGRWVGCRKEPPRDHWTQSKDDHGSAGESPSNQQ
jgi:hypothetical protein